MLFFSILYLLLDDSHFEGVNKFKELVKEEVIKDKVQEKIKENFDTLENYYHKNKIIDDDLENSSKKNMEEKIMESATKETEKKTEKIELDPENVVVCWICNFPFCSEECQQFEEHQQNN